MNGLKHVPVLLKETKRVFKGLVRKEVFMDCTVGAAGHFTSILNAGVGTRLAIGLDCDKTALQMAQKNLQDKLLPPAVHGIDILSLDQPVKHQSETECSSKELQTDSRIVSLYHSGFTHVKQVLSLTGLDNQGLGQVDGLLFDLGVSSMQLDDASRGFSFRKDAPLDMRLDASEGLLSKNTGTTTVGKLLDTSSLEQLSDILQFYGEEPLYLQIAREMKQQRAAGLLNTTIQLKKCVHDVYQREVMDVGPKKRIDRSTKTFQALRIAVNNELENIENTLREVPYLMRRGGRVVVITFHSLESSLVQSHVKTWVDSGIARNLTKVPWTATKWELKANPRSSSAKLFACEFY